METHLKLEHLAPYLPYDLRIKEGNCEFTMDGSFLHNAFEYPLLYRDFKPILRPLFDIDEHELWKRYFMFHYNSMHGLDFTRLPYDEMKLLFMAHFDVFGLLERGLAVSIHDIK